MANVINGLHFILDAKAKEPFKVFTKDNIENMFLQLSKDLEMTIINGPITLEVPVEPEKLTGDSFQDDGGITSFCIISTSHMSLHCWPQRSVIMLDLSSCKGFDKMKAFATINSFMPLEKFEVHSLYRNPTSIKTTSGFIYYVYKITNKLNGKIYIGKSSEKNIKERWKKHCSLSRRQSYIQRAIQKYGKDNFTFEIIEKIELENESYDYEKDWIKFYNSNNKENGYNLNEGGRGNITGKPISNETRNKMSISAKIRANTPEFKIQVSERNKLAIGSKNPNYNNHKLAGSKNPKAKLTKEIVKQILTDHASKLFTTKQLASKYNLSISGIEKIIYKQNWKHVII